MKFRIKDEDGNQYIVEEDKREDIVKDEDDIIEENVEAIEELKDEDAAALTPDEITALKQLAAIAPKLMELANPSVTDEDEVEEEIDEDDTEEEFDNELTEEDKEQVVDTDEVVEEEEKKMTTDSAKSFGSIEKRKASIADNSLNDEVSAAWQKRLNGGLK